MTQTETPLQWGTFLVDLGTEATDFNQVQWINRFSALLWQVPDQLGVVNVALRGQDGRIALQVLAVDPDVAVRRAYELGDEEGPEVVRL